MTARSVVRRLAASVVPLLASLSAHAQLAEPAPIRQTIDANGVNLFDRTMNVDAPALTIGAGEPQGLRYYKLNRGFGWADNLLATLVLTDTTTPGTITVSLGGVSDQFTVASGVFTSVQRNGATLNFNSTTQMYSYRRADGTMILFDRNKRTPAPFYADEGRVKEAAFPSGAKLRFAYETATYCRPNAAHTACASRPTVSRLTNVDNSYGYRVVFSYDDTTFDPNDPDDIPQVELWSTIIGAAVSNLAATSAAAIASQSFAYEVIGGTRYFAVTDPMARITRYRMAGAQVTGIRRNGSSADDVTVGYSGLDVASVTTAAGTTGYSAVDASGLRTVSVTDATSHVTTYVFDIATTRLMSVTDALGNLTAYDYDGTTSLVTKITYPELNRTEFEYDARGNVTKRRAVAKPGSALADIETSAAYDAACTNPLTCNQPTTTTDARGAVTDYMYDPTHGGVTRVQQPAPAAGQPRPEVTYAYTALQAYYRNGAGAIVASGDTIYRQTSTTACPTAATCTGTVQEIKSVTDYGPQTSGVGNTLLPVAVSSGSGDGTLRAVTRFAYDARGNLVSSDGPLPGADDTSYARYDDDRETVGMISPDPDGSGTAYTKRRATRLSYDGKGRVSRVEAGTVNGPSDSDWAAFAPVQATTTEYDGIDRPLVQRLNSVSGTAEVTHQLTQWSYDAQRLECTALRMDPVLWGLLPASACTAQGGAVADRIVKPGYDALDRVTSSTSGYGTTAASTDSVAYSANGQTLSTTDGETNRTGYSYDGFDRLSELHYPIKTGTKPASSTTDYQAYQYDANGNVTALRLRDATQVGFAYDALNRQITKTRPSSEGVVSYGYDLTGRLTSAADSASGIAETLSYDALSRLTSDAGLVGTLGYAYDLAGRRTRVTWPDGYYATYDYLVTGEVQAVRENGATSGVGQLGLYAYDDLGRRTSLTRGNGIVTGYGYDANQPLGWMTSLSQDLTAARDDLTVGFTYNAAGQLANRSASNDLYSYGGYAPKSETASVNGLNQATAVASTALGYDARGNTTAIGAASYAYTSDNLLKTAGATTLKYDPFDRLIDYDTGTSTRFLRDGGNIAAEVAPAGAVTRRYVWGPGADELLVWYDGAGTSERRFVASDERGSVIATTDTSGATLGLNRYDEYGVPSSGNLGRMGYTGQAWLSELGLYDYKARMYAPALGRFLQTDPIGYAGGMNLYAYVGGDPVNFSDPSGTTVIVSACAWGLTRVGGACMSDFQVGRFLEGLTQGAGIGQSGLPEVEQIFDDVVVSATRLSGQTPRRGSMTLLPQNNCYFVAGVMVCPSPPTPKQSKPDFCGSSGTEGIPDTVGGTDISGPCGDHDLCYASSTPRSTCDQNLMVDIWKECSKGSRTAGCYHSGVMYYLGLRLFGGPAYRKAHESP